uniref:Phospholipid scramblase n=1 Tax=Fundulus heteroclitus TaxID=8078 RepID=A0A3Q2NQ39_FUNHE
MGCGAGPEGNTHFSPACPGASPGPEELLQRVLRMRVPVGSFIGFETNNQYEIKNSLGQKIYKAKEKNDCCTRNCCGSLRSFDMKIKDNMDREVIRLIRPFRCVSCCCPCCLQELEVQAPPGTTVGFVKQDWHPFLPKFSIQGADGQTVLRLEGPCFACNCCGDVNFEVICPERSSLSFDRSSKSLFHIDLGGFIINQLAQVIFSCLIIMFFFFFSHLKLRCYKI